MFSMQSKISSRNASAKANQWRKPFDMALKLLFVLFAICTANVGSVVRVAAAPNSVTQNGPVKGIAAPGIDEFLGIPYAAPPVGNLRWRPPQPHANWQGVLDATHLGNFCIEPDGAGGTSGSEDCLFLNVYRPSQNEDSQGENENGDGLPVMVWIHGDGTDGGFNDPTALVKKRVVVVTINYRFHVLGFFAHPAVDAEGHLNANYGLMDQQFALKWVKRNIGAFGGDPKRVTMFGESGGGISVYSNLASPTAAGLFQRVISQSGAGAQFQDYFNLIVPLATAETAGSAFAASVGCSGQTAQTGTCLRALSASTLILADKNPNEVDPVVDGTVLSQTPGSAFASGQFNRVPVISGSNHDEFRLFLAFQFDYSGNPLTDPDYVTAVANFFGTSQSDPFVQFLVNVAYPLSNYPPPAGVMSAPLAFGALTTDFVNACPTLNANRLLSRYVPTYAYQFNDENAPLDFGLQPASFPLGAYHGAEIQYLEPPAPAGAFTVAQEQLSDMMMRYWTKFAKTGNPNSTGSPLWSSFSATTNEFQSLVPPTPVVESDFDTSHQCSSLWNTF
jgi:para-nitrobenzyl esterase